MISLEDQVKEAKRELALRKKLYPGWVKTGRLTEGQAAYCVEAMETIVKTLTRLELEQRQLSLL